MLAEGSCFPASSPQREVGSLAGLEVMIYYALLCFFVGALSEWFLSGDPDPVPASSWSLLEMQILWTNLRVTRSEAALGGGMSTLSSPPGDLESSQSTT